MHGKTHSLTLTLPPLGVLFLKRDAPEAVGFDEIEEAGFEAGDEEE
jgi:hypothetical protein